MPSPMPATKTDHEPPNGDERVFEEHHERLADILAVAEQPLVEPIVGGELGKRDRRDVFDAREHAVRAARIVREYPPGEGLVGDDQTDQTEDLPVVGQKLSPSCAIATAEQAFRWLKHPSRGAQPGLLILRQLAP